MYLHKLPLGQRPGLGSLLSPSCPSSSHGHCIVACSRHLRSSASTLTNPSCGLQQLLDYKNLGLLSRGAISLHSECSQGQHPPASPSCYPTPNSNYAKHSWGLLSPEGKVTWGRRGKAKVISHSHAAGLGFLGLVFQSIWKRTTFSSGKGVPGLRPRRWLEAKPLDSHTSTHKRCAHTSAAVKEPGISRKPLP